MFSDYLLLLLLLFLFLFGDMMSWGNSWSAHGFVMTKQDFAKYFDGVARFTFADPRAVLPGLALSLRRDPRAPRGSCSSSSCRSPRSCTPSSACPSTC